MFVAQERCDSFGYKSSLSDFGGNGAENAQKIFC